MKKNTQNVIELYDKFVYSNNTLKGWSIVIMPDKILIDNFHHGHAHIHPDRKEIKTKSLNDTFKIVIEHINNNKGVKYDKLREELI
jgi:hypothetical protein